MEGEEGGGGNGSSGYVKMNVISVEVESETMTMDDIACGEDVDDLEAGGQAPNLGGPLE